MEWSSMLIFLTSFAISILISSAFSGSSFGKWSLVKDQVVTEYQYTTSALSSLDCVRECMKHFQCDSFAFDSKSGTCFVQVTTKWNMNNTVQPMKIFKAVPHCLVPDIDMNVTTTNTVWRKDGWEMEGNVTCDDDYMNIGDSPTFRCSASGQWTAHDWECRQRVWRNPKVKDDLSVPQTPTAGWTVCMNGTPTQPSRFNLNFAKDEKNTALHADARFNFEDSTNTMVLAYMVNNSWPNTIGLPVDPFPLAINRSFQMVIRAETLYDAQLFVDGTFINNFTTTISLGEVTTVFVEGDVDVDMLDLWCDQ